MCSVHLPQKNASDFTGTIVVAPNAYKTEARLDNKHLLLSKHAEAKTKPELEIHNGDIHCTHGATIGYLDQDALFYLKSRGIPEVEAKQLLVTAFIQPTLENIPTTALTQHIQGMLHGY